MSIAWPRRCRLPLTTPLLLWRRVSLVEGESVARDDLKRSLAAHRRRQPLQQVEQRRIDGADIAAAEIAHQVVDGRQGVGQVAAGSEILNA